MNDTFFRIPSYRIARLIVVACLCLFGAYGSLAMAQTLTVYSFSGWDGATPWFAGLVQGSDGNFYGTTMDGGDLPNYNYGTVFRITPGGNLQLLHTFSGAPGDGAYPESGLVQGTDGNFYGTTANGGDISPWNYGTVFRVTPGGSVTILHSFTNYDGATPIAPLVQGSDGNFYGATSEGGPSTNCVNGCGTVFRISPSGSFQLLHPFSRADGQSPNALLQGSDGYFYGTTYIGGYTGLCGGNGCGTVFRVSPNGDFQLLYTFSGYPIDGSYPMAGLVPGSDGNFYGTTSQGGVTCFAGSVFRISSSGSLTSLCSFDCGSGVYGNSSVGLVQGSDGNFYQLADSGGVPVLFRISPSGNATNLYCSDYATLPIFPSCLVQGIDGNFYGTSSSGGTGTNCSNGCGTVFKVTVPLNPPANQISSIQRASTNLVFSIPSVAYETYQLQFSSSMNPPNWVNVPAVSVTNSIGALLTLTNLGGAIGPQGFYRFSITP
jgi:uncharacterized repeat protein (TIGR03803 family)